ncbi:MAG: TerB family tellurite resistance protein, partial [Pseudomonadales bacterium]|nr:TerB family tellurite resistance protein [Pseudomonadales bacterium]
ATDDANDLYQFTKLGNEHYSHADKERLLEKLWKVAYVDGRIDRYEEQFVRKVAGLLHLAHSSFIRTKISARDAMDQ